MLGVVLLRHPSIRRIAERRKTTQTNIRGRRYMIRRMNQPYPWFPRLYEPVVTFRGKGLHTGNQHLKNHCGFQWHLTQEVLSQPLERLPLLLQLNNNNNYDNVNSNKRIILVIIIIII